MRAPSEGLVRDPLFIDDEAKRALDPLLDPRKPLRVLESDHQHDDGSSVEAILMLGHLHEMAFAEESPYVAQKAEDDGMASKVAKPHEFP
jgi:hypothetical protein